MDESAILSAFKFIRVPLMIVGQDGAILHCNDAAARLFGYSVHALSGRPVFDVLPVASVAELNALIAPGADDVIIQGMMGQKRSGSEVSLGIHITAWSDEEHGPRHAMVLRDITDQIKAEELAKDDLSLANSAIKIARIGVFGFNPVTDAVTVSSIWCDIMGLDPHAQIDFREEWISRIHPDDIEKVMELVQACAEGVREKVSYACRLRSRDDKQWLWMGSNLSVAKRDAAGNVTRVIGAMTDITERKTIEIALQKAEEQFRSAYESAVVGMAVVSLDGTWLRVNPALCELLGYSEDEMLSADIQSFTHPDDLDESRVRMDLLMAGDIPSYQIEKRYIRANGAYMWALVSVGVVRDGDGQPEQFVFQILDITQQRRLAQLKSEFVSTVSHELRTPLTSVLGSLDLLSLMDDEPFSDEAQRLLFIAQENGKRLHALINDVLDFEQFSVMQMRFELSRQNISSLVEEAVLTNMVSADKFRVRFKINCSDRSLKGFVDTKRFQQVMANLLTNAAKFADEGSTIDVSVEGEPKVVKVSITNDGVGISDEFSEQIFKPFAQAVPTATRKRDGTGLGLNITKQIVEQTGGTIGFNSAVGARTTFWFTVPVNKPG